MYIYTMYHWPALRATSARAVASRDFTYVVIRGWIKSAATYYISVRAARAISTSEVLYQLPVH